MFFKFENCINFKSRIWVVYANWIGPLVRDARRDGFCVLLQITGFMVLTSSLWSLYYTIRDDMMMHIGDLSVAVLWMENLFFFNWIYFESELFVCSRLKKCLVDDFRLNGILAMSVNKSEMIVGIMWGLFWGDFIDDTLRV